MSSNPRTPPLHQSQIDADDLDIRKFATLSPLEQIEQLAADSARIKAEERERREALEKLRQKACGNEK